jgi:hypothetical protein
MSPSVNAMLNCIDKALAERDNNLKKFCQSLDKDIAELGRELKEVKRDSQVNSYHIKVHLQLQFLMLVISGSRLQLPIQLKIHYSCYKLLLWVPRSLNCDFQYLTIGNLVLLNGCNRDFVCFCVVWPVKC